MANKIFTTEIFANILRVFVNVLAYLSDMNVHSKHKILACRRVLCTYMI